MKWFTTVLMIALLASTTALAHGPQIQITNTGGKIVTRDLIGDGSYLNPSPARTVYVMPVLEDLGIWYTRPNTTELPIIGGPQYYSGPGIAYGSQDGIPEAFAEGESFSLNFTQRLLEWNGTGFVDPGDEEVQGFVSATNFSSVATTSDDGPLQSLLFPTLGNYSANAHTTARFRFLGNGSSATTEPDDGIYLLSLQLSTSEDDILDSDEFYFVMHKNAPHADIRAAIDALGVLPSAVQVVGQVIPEPSTVVIASVAVCSLAMRRKRKV